jgi:Lrp/AsnC family transcriptional regulator, leucine-responsive regulatory protein
MVAGSAAAQNGNPPAFRCWQLWIVDPIALGYPLTAFVRIRMNTPAGKAFHDLLDGTPQVLEAHYITGEDCFLLKLIARSMPDLQHLTGKFLTFGQVTTNLTYSSPVRDRPLPPSADESDWAGLLPVQAERPEDQRSG